MSKVALITGSSRGIGAATAIRLAKDGYDICVNYHSDEASANQVVEKIRELGRKAISVKADVSLEEDVAHLFETLDIEFGSLDSLVNNAGILMQQCKEAIKRMATKHGGQGGTIVNVSSAAARLGSGGEYVDYAASKGAIDSLTLGLATELAEEGIRVNGVRPGVIYTDIHSDGGEPNRVERIKKNIPLKAWRKCRGSGGSYCLVGF
ncbi:putative oxidoreductase YgfF [Nymphon striatum]|nr:putative oxidoreductase YgfF [Nymphon striatum]